MARKHTQQRKDGLYQREPGGVWYYDIPAIAGKHPRLRGSTGEREEAKAREVLDLKRAERHSAVAPVLGPRQAVSVGVVRNLASAIVKYVGENGGKRSADTDAQRLEFWNRELGGVLVADITTDMVRERTDEIARTRTPSTANRYVAAIGQVLSACATGRYGRKRKLAWGWIQTRPPLAKYDEPKRRIRDLTGDQLKKLVTELPEHQRDCFLFAVCTGLRQANIIGLRWDWLNLDNRTGFIPAEEFKTDADHGFPLNDDAMEILAKWKGVHREYVFAYRPACPGGALGEPRPIASTLSTRAWYKALKRAGIEEFRWHDSRHVWASALVRAGVTLFELMELAGWSSPEMARRYAHLNPGHLAGAASKINGIASVAQSPQPVCHE